ncbi:NADP-dependent oxidoreductase domain [Pseudocohnilembus persalinus]|uniref:NADP-dependent oxidoreductase domain n=1 Tax=Pseudocohnilembus persalinus TaxID=266149 RepID=A0A0V0QWG1_PSEPJ|nr:NADP-dependent oxidoreductase domain [Pseudocohnilembus persalinus]|eukprot:KRX06729.1 NADP-dependent oxidoreductase domain [Pseudocohnilembus persalinus]
MEQNNSNQFQFPMIQLKNGTKIPQIGFGTYQLKEPDCYNSVLYALQIGYRHIDTASIYKNEKYIGQAIKDFLQQNKDKGIKRNDLFIVSKINPSEQGYEKTIQAVQDIISRLQLEYIDLILIHWPGVKKFDPSSPDQKEIRQGSWKALNELKKQNLVKNIGVSNFLQRHLESLEELNLEIPAINQFELHPLLLNQQLVDYCNKKQIQVEAYSSLARQDEKLYKNELMIEISQKYKKSISQICLKWSIQKGNVVIPKSKTQKYIAQNLDIFNFQISEEDMQKINKMDLNFHTCWNPETVY